MNKKFIEIRKEIILKLSYKSRNISPTDLKYYLKKEGYEKICLGCGQKLYGRNKSWCNGDCSYNFYSKYVWTNLRSRLIRESKFKCQSCESDDFPLEVHHIHPICLGGDPFEEDNLIVLCADCHLDSHTELGINNKELRDKLYYENYLKINKIKPLDLFFNLNNNMVRL